MISRKEFRAAQKRAVRMMADAGIALSKPEKAGIEVADFGLGELARTGLEIVTYVNNDRYCAKELVLFPRQTCPEHRHPGRGRQPGKRETFRCRAGVVYLYVEGLASKRPKARPPEAPPGAYTVFHEIILRRGEQCTLEPDTLHWFQAGRDGAVVSEFSSPSDDAGDIFTDRRIVRVPELAP